MSETCIVCLGDLGENASAVPLPAEELVSEIDAKLTAEDVNPRPQSPPPLKSPILIGDSPSPDADTIAHLRPCGHNLHDQCLKPWVERANSCPICRRTFNEVQLKKTIDGPVVSSYPVEDRTQVADVDPLLIVDEEEEPDFQPCQICGNDEHEEVLLLCEDCGQPWHTYCIGLNEVPSGDWYCEECSVNRARAASLNEAQPRRPRRAGRRTVAAIRRSRDDSLAQSSDWARVWRTVRDRTTIDLDFPFDNRNYASSSFSDFSLDHQPQRHFGGFGGIRGRRDSNLSRQAWEQRLRIAERQGGTRQLRSIAPPFEDDAPAPSRPRPEPEEPESTEEIRAWNAMEKARDIEAAPPGRSRKRRRTRSITASPSSPHPHPAPDPTPRKRPRVRRHEVQEHITDRGESSSARQPRTVNQQLNLTNGESVPTFLQSLLKEVESSTTPSEEQRGRPTLSLRHLPDHASPRGSSPEVSPTSSNAPSPRAASASPAPTTRPGSPHLTSCIEPVYPHIGPNGDLSPVSPSQSLDRAQPKPKSRVDIPNRTRNWVENIESSPTRADQSSPRRKSLTLSVKEKVQKFVVDALREPYQKKQLDKDQYTEINRNVSRMLYEKTGEVGDIDEEEAEELVLMAKEEVAKAVDALQTSNAASQ